MTGDFKFGSVIFCKLIRDGFHQKSMKPSISWHCRFNVQTIFFDIINENFHDSVFISLEQSVNNWKSRTHLKIDHQLRVTPDAISEASACKAEPTECRRRQDPQTIKYFEDGFLISLYCLKYGREIMTQVKVRFAPSPTGSLHIGGARTALYNWLFARHHGGSFLLRIEDTDWERSTKEFEQSILDGMRWLGLTWDGDPIYQSARTDLYKDHIARLVAEGKAYYCTCTKEELEAKRQKALASGQKPKYDGTCRNKNAERSANTVVRFRAPEKGVTSFNDLCRGEITFENSELDDLVIARADGSPTYNLTVVVDDALMGITHIIRGDDHIANTPRQMLLYQALGFPVPALAHLPMIY